MLLILKLLFVKELWKKLHHSSHKNIKQYFNISEGSCDIED